ncbi:MAG: hypothetical protein HY064_11160 [Bacteroidetes bacterium]|nr:hypothetical protein [Bacteroidota bacterium]
MRSIYAAFIILLLSGFSLATETNSFFYRNDGKLKADTTLKISSYRLHKWMKVEDTIVKTFSKNIQYPLMLKENGIQGKLIVSFDVDDSSNFSNITWEKDTAQHYLKLFFMEIKRGISLQSGRYFSMGFKAAPGKKEHYFIPFAFAFHADYKLKGTENYLEIITEPEKQPEPFEENEMIRME